jgi:hypothetical protein
LLKARDVAQRLGVGVDWVYHHSRELPFTVKLGRVPRFLSAWLILIAGPNGAGKTTLTGGAVLRFKNTQTARA